VSQSQICLAIASLIRLHAIAQDESKQSKELLFYHCRIFVMTNVKGPNKSKYAIIGTDQSSTVSSESEGSQSGVLPLCLDFQCFFFGKWTNWPGMGSPNLHQVLPASARQEGCQETYFTEFVDGCLRHIKASNPLSAQGKVKLCVWYNGIATSDAASSQEAIDKSNINNGNYIRICFCNILMDFYSKAIIKANKVQWENTPQLYLCQV
jgi:hypothetical protein